MALSSAAVLGVYAAGFVRTRAAAQRFAEADLRRTPVRAQVSATTAPAESIATREAPAPVAPPALVVAAAPSPAADPVSPGVERDRAPATAPRSSRPAGKTPAPTAKPRAERIDTTSTTATPAASAPELPPVPVPDPSPATAPVPATPTAVAVPQSVPASPPAAPATAPTYKDGTYSGWGTSRHGDIQATVVIENGRIASASISQCYTRYPCSWITALPPQVAQRQSPEVDYVSGATQSTNAFYYAVIEALAKAK